MSIWNNLQQYFGKPTEGKDTGGGFTGVTVPFQSQRFPSYAHMYKHVSDDYLIEDILHFDEIVARMRDYAEPVYMEYAEISDNLAFKKISADFYQYLFGNNTIYVGYYPGDDEYPEQFHLYDAHPMPDGTFTETTYYNLITKTMDEISPEAAQFYFIKVMGDGQSENMRFKKGYKVAYTMTLCEHTLNNNLLMGTKKLMCTHGGTDAKVKQRTENDRNFLFNLSPVINLYRDLEDSMSTPVPITLVGGADAHAGLSACYFFLDRELAILGLVSNLNHKGERLTTGENYKDIHAIKNRQAMVLDQLNLFAQLLKEKYIVPSLEFEVRFTDDPAAASSPDNTTSENYMR